MVFEMRTQNLVPPGDFLVSFQLGGDVDPSTLENVLANGVLEGDLSNNKLMGDIPKCFNNFSVLSGNEIIIGDHFTINTIYDKVFIGSDSLVMKGHEYMYSSILKLMMLLDLSNNNLVGHIPSELTTLIKLKLLNLSSNHLTGRIPEKIGDLKELEFFDLSLNKLSGHGGLHISVS
ncbi:leucine-rich repeat protein [Tanacetum coccineum]